MATVRSVLAELKQLGSEHTRRTLARHGAQPPMFGVKIADLKSIAKRIKGDQDLALALFETQNYDAMYLAGLVADGSRMTRKALESWARTATCETISSTAVAWVATESRCARGLAIKWIRSTRETIAVGGWATYTGMVATYADDRLDLDEVQQLLDRVVDGIDKAPNGVRYMMNGFVIAVGTHLKPMQKAAKSAARSLGTVTVDMGDTACKVPSASDSIAKVAKMGRVGIKRKTIRC